MPSPSLILQSVVIFLEDYKPLHPENAKELPSASLSSAQDPANAPQTTSSTAPMSAEWLQMLRWGPWLQLSKAEPATLRELIEIPSMGKILTCKNSESRERLELVLLAVHQLLDGYLQDANAYVQGKHSDVRAHIHAGYKSTFDSTLKL